jgi:hypothetical protein
MTGLAEKVNTPATQDAYVFALVEAAALKLILGQTDTVRKDLDAATKILDTFDSVDSVIHAAFYRVNADYYSVCRHIAELILRAKSTTLTTTVMPSSTSHVFLSLLRFRKRKRKSAHTILASQLSLAKKYTTLENYYYIQFSKS